MDVVSILLARITKLATNRQTPFIVIENPAYEAAKIERPNSPTTWPERLLATIGNVSVSFYGYSPLELIDLYAELKAGLAAGDARQKASREAWDQAHKAYSGDSSNAKSLK